MGGDNGVIGGLDSVIKDKNGVDDNKNLLKENQGNIEVTGGISKDINGVDEFGPVSRNNGRWHTVGGGNFCKGKPLTERNSETLEHHNDINDNYEEIVDNFPAKDAISHLSHDHDEQGDIILMDNEDSSASAEKKVDVLISTTKGQNNLSKEEYRDEEEWSSLKSNYKESKGQTNNIKKNFKGFSTSASSNICKFKDVSINNFKSKANNEKLSLIKQDSKKIIEEDKIDDIYVGKEETKAAVVELKKEIIKEEERLKSHHSKDNAKEKRRVTVLPKTSYEHKHPTILQRINATNQNQNDSYQSVTILIEGMTCQGCAQTVRFALR